MARYIDADELLKRLNACKYPVEKTTMRQVTYNAAISDACRGVDTMPAADVQEVRHGRWINTQYPYGKCSECGCFLDTVENETNYCPNCGSRMDLDGDTE